MPRNGVNETDTVGERRDSTARVAARFAAAVAPNARYDAEKGSGREKKGRPEGRPFSHSALTRA
ncbi:hypothetical protein L3i23_25840 [Herbiconiux sp. L3-i23]|nr:hypothetical protein L3i23_25840 [Herbiconiux sp. L3-i23]